MKTHQQEAQDIQDARFRSMTPTEKIHAIFRLRESAWTLKAAWLRKQNPDLPESEIQRMVKEIFMYARS
jgi:hypothetical protein